MAWRNSLAVVSEGSPLGSKHVALGKGALPDRLSPMPMTDEDQALPLQLFSMRMPPALDPLNMMSLGHLIIRSWL